MTSRPGRRKGGGGGRIASRLVGRHSDLNLGPGAVDLNLRLATSSLVTLRPENEGNIDEIRLENKPWPDFLGGFREKLNTNKVQANFPQNSSELDLKLINWPTK